MKILIILAAILLAIIALLWLGLKIKPSPFPLFASRGKTPQTVPLPSGLPAPVERYFRGLYGDAVPLIETAVVTGRGTLRPVFRGPRIPARFRITHESGKSYRHYIELAFFGIPFTRINEYYNDGKERMELPFGNFEGKKLDESGCLGMWAEMITWFPAPLVTDPQVRWIPVDDTTALMAVPCGESTNHFTFHFSPSSGKMLYWEVMRYHGEESPERTLWVNGTWMDEGTPWSFWNVEDTVFNGPVDTQMTAKGP
jgi:hypothetical protein